MKINLTKFSLSLLAALTLAACGSGGGGAASPNAEQKNPSVEQKNSSTENGAKETPATPSLSDQDIPPMPVRSPGNTGLAFVLRGEDDKVEYSQKDLYSNDLKQIMIDGKTIPISSGLQSSNWENIKAQTINGIHLNGILHSCCGKYDSVRFGAIASNEAGQDDIVFYNGNPAKNIPSSGKFTYKGESILAAEDDKIPDDYMTGTSEFTVDFGNKELSGKLSVNDARVDIKAKIAENRFYGKAESNLSKSIGIAEGRFFGDQGKELGGIVEDTEHSWGGAFGAQKQ